MRTIPALLAAAAREHQDRIWLRTDEIELSFAAAWRQVAALARRLEELGVRPGQPLVITARSTPQHLLVILAATTLGAIAVPTDPRSTAAELSGLLHQLRGEVRFVADAEAIGTVRRVQATALLLEDLTSAAVDLGDDPPYPVDESDVAIMIPTSGTTGRAKLVMQTHRAYVLAGEGFPFWMGLDSTDRLMTALPLFHTNALAYSTMGSLACGAGLVLLPRFSASTFLESARRHGATSFNAVGAMLEFLMAQEPDAGSPLRSCYSAPAPDAARHREIEKRLGIELVCGYGLSESLYGLSWRRGTRPFGTLGHLRQHPTLGAVNQARVVDPQGADCAPGQQGELLLRNPAVATGYYGLPEETAATFQDGWVRTGDLVTENEDGTYTFVARLKEVIRRRGENLSPGEVEEALRACPEVLDCAVAGVPAGPFEEEVKAFVRLVPGAVATPADLAARLGLRLAAFKIPRFWQFVDDLPYTPTGRVAKHRLPTEGAEHDLATTIGEAHA
ncbi:class I adenylate-forming enzyme family protein [Amycolatopsis jejuensis]|uniref:class I adenylate-forming enzyme family protein n=1 Tax=Amycolatopsis jejuensis TaxID=330084 RepID=UPI000ACC4C91|nr:AMP-binding protein [Amycolatopsis jejuensis]